MPLYDHVYALGFRVQSSAADGSDVSHAQLLDAILGRLIEVQRTHLEAGESLVEACDAPFHSKEAANVEP